MDAPVRRPACVLLLALLPVLVGCNAPLLENFDGEGPGALATQGQSLGSVDEQDGESLISDDDVPLVPLTCPEDDEKATLEFDHNISWGVPGSFDINVKTDGMILFNLTQSIATHTPGSKVGIHVIQPAPVTANVTSTVEDCVQEYKSTTSFIPQVRGTCIDGVFNLTIVETWQDPKLTVICDDDDRVKIPLPLGTQTHNVKGSIGEIATKERPYPFKFTGIGGRGKWVYLISYWYIPEAD